MSREHAITVEGTVVEVLPNTVYRVELPNGHRLLAHVSRKMAWKAGDYSLGDKVTVETTPFDLSKGRIS